MTDHHEQLILKLLSGTISTEEQRALNAWMGESEENKKLVNDFMLLWKAGKDQIVVPDFHTGDEWRKLESSISHENVKEENKGQRYLYAYGLKIAASIGAIVLFSWVLYLVVFSHETVLKESVETTLQVTLPDGSSVWLNHHSRLAYQDDFNSKTRIVKLSGEAFFEVKEDRQKPFIIQTTNALVKVLGTSFNVQAYEATDDTEVFVVTGSVNFSNLKNREGITLKPGETGITKNNTVVLLDTEESLNALAWKEKRLIFKKSSISTVVEDLETYFKIDLEIRNKDILHCRFTGSFNQPTLEEIIEALSVSLDLTIAKEDDVYIVDGDGC